VLAVGADFGPGVASRTPASTPLITRTNMQKVHKRGTIAFASSRNKLSDPESSNSHHRMDWGQKSRRWDAFSFDTAANTTGFQNPRTR